MVSHPETGSDSPIGSDRDRGRDNRSSYDVLKSQNTVTSPPKGAAMFADFLQVLELA